MKDKPVLEKSGKRPATPRSLIAIALAFGAMFYLADAVIDVYVFQRGSFLEQLLHPPWYEVEMRLTILLVFLAFAAYAGVLLRRAQMAATRAQTAEKFLNSILDNIPAMVFIKDARELRFVRVNAVGERLLGLSMQELIGKNDYDFFPKAQADFFTGKDREVLNTGVVLAIPEEEIDTQLQGRRVLYTRKVPIPDEAGRPAYLLGISDDITDIKQAQAALRETEIRLQTLFDAAAEFIFVIDPEGIIHMVNRRAVQQLGYAEAELRGKNIKEFFIERSRHACERNFPLLKERGYLLIDVEFGCKDGPILQMECSATAIPDKAEKLTSFLVILRDVTESRRAREELAQHQRDLAHMSRLSTLGEMASGIAHELNQPLTAIASYCESAVMLMNLQPQLPASLIEIVKRTTEQAHRASMIVRQLREFTAKRMDSMELLDPDALVRKAIRLLDWELRDTHTGIELQLAGEGRRILANKVQIEQVMVNLVRNSLEAIREAGVVEGHITIQSRLLPNDVVELSVADNGAGVAADMVERLFIPFQSKKPDGTGLGLSVSRSIIESHGGKLWFDKGQRNGALFRFTLPVHIDSEARD